MSFLNCFYSFITALFASLIMVPFLRQWALERGALDHPDGRRQHTEPTPRLGGVAIFLAIMFSAMVFAPESHAVNGILAGVLVIFATGMMDDINGIRASHKFFGQIVACLVTMNVGGLYLVNLGNLFGFGDLILPTWLGILFTMFAVIGVVNAINLIDGLDGLAGGVSIIALTTFILLGALDGDKVTVLLASASIGAILGFLKYNFYPARIFMGDTGSMVLGFLLGFLAINMTQHPGATTSPMVPILVLGLPLIDTVWVMTRRVRMGLSPFVADRSHVHHKFLDLGFEHRFTVIIILGISAIWSCLAVILHSAPEYLLLFLYLFTFLCFYLALRYVMHNREHFPLLQRDTNIEIRATVTYRKVSQLIDSLVPSIKYLLAGYLLLAAWSVLAHNTLPWQVPVPMILIGGFLIWRPVTQERHFLILIAYITAGMAAVEVWHANAPLIGAVSMKDCGDALLGVAGLIAVLKIQFRKIGEFFLNTTDFLALAICILLAIASQQHVLDFELSGPLFRTILLMLAIRAIVFRNRFEQSLVLGGSLGFLALVIVAGLFM